jgi:HEAT repeat protein
VGADPDAVARWHELRALRESQLLDQLSAPIGRRRPVELLVRRRNVNRIVELSTFASDASVPLMSQYLRSAVRRHRVAASFVLRKIGSQSATDAMKQRELHLLDQLPAAGSKRARLDFFSDLDLVASDVSVPLMREYLFSDVPNDRVAAIITLGAIGSPLAAGALLEALPRQNSEGVSFTVDALLRNDLLTRENVPVLTGCLERRRDQIGPTAKLGLMVAMRSEPDPSQVPVLVALVGDKKRRVRRGAAVSLKRLGTAEAAVALRAALGRVVQLKSNLDLGIDGHLPRCDVDDLSFFLDVSIPATG